MSDRLLPSNATNAEVALDQSTARLSDVPVPIADLWNPQSCPLSVLPWLAWAFSVDVWDASWSEPVKRAVIERSVEVHRRKGTRRAVELAIASLGSDAQIIEWWEAGAAQGADPGTFTVRLSVAELLTSGVLISDVIDQLVLVIDRVKPASAHYDVSAVIQSRARTYLGATSYHRMRALNIGGIPPAPIVSTAAGCGVTGWAQIIGPAVRVERVT